MRTLPSRLLPKALSFTKMIFFCLIFIFLVSSGTDDAVGCVVCTPKSLVVFLVNDPAVAAEVDLDADNTVDIDSEASDYVDMDTPCADSDAANNVDSYYFFRFYKI